MRKVLKLLTSKVFLYSIMILLQFAAIYYVLAYLSEQSSNWQYLAYVTRGLAFLVAVYIVNTPMIPEYKIAWIVPILLLPIFGVTLYLILGRKNFNRHNEFFKQSKQLMEPFLHQNDDVLVRSRGTDYFVAQMGTYVYNASRGRINYGDTVKYYPSGELLYADILEAIKGAQKYVFMEYFIMRPGKMLNSIIDLLLEKIKEGVEVYILYDDLACTFKMPRRYLRKMTKGGIKLRGFQPLAPFISATTNNRNHRKLTVIDGRIGFTGGVNLSDEYINEVHPFGKWKDCGVKVQGKTVEDMVLTFIQMWNNTFRKNQDKISDIKHFLYDDYQVQPSTAYTIFINDTPLDSDSTSENAYMKMVEQATKYVYITTPYLIINYDIRNSLTLAAKSGVDVRIIIPGTPDKKTAYSLTKAFASQLIQKGVKVYFYKPGFIHAKSFVVDDQYSIVGTANLDYRSLYLHYECSLFVYDKQFAYGVKEDYLRTLQDCELVTPKLLKTNIFTRAWCALLRMLAPLF